MEDERFRELLARVTNFNWMPPFGWDKAFCDVNPGYAHLLVPYYPPAVRPPDAEYDEYRKLLREFCRAPSAARDADEEFRKRLREFLRVLRRDFPEWHFHDSKLTFEGGSINQAGHLVANAKQLQHDLRRVWELASTKETDEAKRILLQVKLKFSRTLKVKEKYNHASNGWEHDKRAFGLMMETMDWLQNRLRKLKVCENPKCHGRKYFFKTYNNDKYCCDRCIAKAKALRKAKREAESQKPLKVPTKSPATLKKMAESASKRWDEYRAKTGNLKGERSQKPRQHAR